MTDATPMIDSHCHAWTLWPYQPPVPDDTTRGTVEQLLWEMDQAGVAQACIVAANIERNPDNNAYVADVVARHRDRLHHFAHIDCVWEPTYNADGAADRLDALVARYRPAGVTRYFDTRVDDWPLSEEGLAFFARAQAHGLIMSLAVAPQWHPVIGEVAQRFPDMAFMIHHIGAFRMGDGDLRADFDRLVGLAARPNVHVKISGFHYGTERPWDFPQADTIAWLRRLYEATGADRWCWGTDYPVLKRDRSFTYLQTIETIRRHCAFLADDEVPRVLGGTLDMLLKRHKEAR